MKGRLEAFLRKTTLTDGLVTPSICEVRIVGALTSAFSTFRLRCKCKLTLDVFLAGIADVSGHCRNNMVISYKCPLNRFMFRQKTVIQISYILLIKVKTHRALFFIYISEIYDITSEGDLVKLRKFQKCSSDIIICRWTKYPQNASQFAMFILTIWNF